MIIDRKMIKDPFHVVAKATALAVGTPKIAMQETIGESLKQLVGSVGVAHGCQQVTADRSAVPLEKLTLGGDGGGVFDLDSRGAVTLTVTRVTTAGPPAAEVTDALAGRAQTAVVLGDLPAGSRAALSHLADFFNTPAEQGQP